VRGLHPSYQPHAVDGIGLLFSQNCTKTGSVSIASTISSQRGMRHGACRERVTERKSNKYRIGTETGLDVEGNTACAFPSVGARRGNGAHSTDVGSFSANDKLIIFKN